MMNIILFIIAIPCAILYIVISYFIRRRNRKLLCSVSSPSRGTQSERRLVVKLLKKGIHPKAIFHDLYLPRRNGEYSQVDIVVALPQGLLAIEVKDYSGWLFGNESDKYWTQVLNFGKEKHRFYNPIMQNSGHIKALREQSEQFEQLPIFNLVLFTKECTLRDVTYYSDNTFVGYTDNITDVLKRIRQRESAHYTDKKEVARLLRSAVNNGYDPDVVASHLAYVQKKSAYI